MECESNIQKKNIGDTSDLCKREKYLKKSDALIYALSKKMLIFLFLYYWIILFFGGVASIKIACELMDDLEKVYILRSAFILSIAVSGMLCSIQYIKRLYKACLTGRIDNNGDFIKYVGNITYFIFRPFFAFSFSIIMVFMLLSGMFVVSGSLDYIMNNKFVYLCVVISSFLGYSVGNILDRFEKISEEKVSKFI